MMKLNIGGSAVTKMLMNLFIRSGYFLDPITDFETISDVKEKFCYVCADPKFETKLSRDTTCLESEFTMPDGKVLNFGQERFLAPEVLFSPSLLDSIDEGKGLPEVVFDSIMRSPIDFRKTLFNQVVISGGSSMFPGFPTRLENDLREIHLQKVLNGNVARQGTYPVRIEDPPRRKHGVFLGASVLADMWQQENMLAQCAISRQEYQEYGVNCIHRLISTKLH